MSGANYPPRLEDLHERIEELEQERNAALARVAELEAPRVPELPAVPAVNQPVPNNDLALGFLSGLLLLAGAFAVGVAASQQPRCRCRRDRCRGCR